MKVLLLFCILMSSLDAFQTNEGTKAFMQGKYKEAKKYFTKTCDNGNTSDCIALASIYFYGLDTQKDTNKTKELYEKIITLGDARGYTNIGSMYFRGTGVQRDINKAYKYFTQGCDANASFSCVYLFMKYEKSRGIQDDILKAKIFKDKAILLLGVECEKSDAMSCKQLESMIKY